MHNNTAICIATEILMERFIKTNHRAHRDYFKLETVEKPKKRLY